MFTTRKSLVLIVLVVFVGIYAFTPTTATSQTPGKNSANYLYRAEKPRTIDHSVPRDNIEKLRVLSDTIYSGWKDPYYWLASYWAPVIYQYTQSNGGTDYLQDFITRFDYDGDWIGNNNWDNFDAYSNSLYAYVYYAVIESETDYFIFYMFYHPRDWGAIFGLIPDTHENDMEGAMLVIHKDGTQYGKLLVITTRAHTDFYQYSNDPNIGDGVADNVDDDVDFDTVTGKPIVYVEAQGHGVYCTQSKVDDYYSNDGLVIYRFNNNISEIPSGGNDDNVYYALLPIMTTLWNRRNLVGDGSMYDQPFTYQGGRYSFVDTVPGSFDGDDGSADAANPPWGMHDSDNENYDIYRGDWFFDPAYVISKYFSIPYTFSLTYTYNPYLIESGPEFVPPEITIYSPESGGYLGSSQVNISWSVTDDYSLYGLYVSIDGSVVYEGTALGFNSVIVNLDEGYHQLNITAIDIWGNYKTIIRDFYIDLTPPSFSGFNIANSTVMNYTSALTVSWAFTDNYGIDHYEISIDNSQWINTGTNTEYTFENLSLYNHTLRVTAYDYAGNTMTATLNFRLEPVQVSVKISNGNETSTMPVASGGIILLSLGEGDYTSVEAYFNDTPASIVDNSIKVPPLEDGKYTLKIRVYYPSGEFVDSNYTVLIDNTPPTITSIYMEKNSTTINVSWIATDTVAGIHHYEVMLDGTWVYYGEDPYYTININSLTPGIHALIIRAYDILGHFTQKIKLFVVDTDTPTITVFSLDNNSILDINTTSITILVHDKAGIESIEVYINSSLWGTYNNNATIILKFPQDGNYTIKIVATDTQGNTATTQLYITVDTTPPNLEIITPQDMGEYPTGTIQISWTGDGDTYYIKIDNGTWICLGQTNNYTATLNAGIHTIYILAVDKAGNQTQKAITIITKDENN